MCVAETPLEGAGGIDGLKTNTIIQNLTNQVRSALVGSPPRSECKIHEGKMVEVHCDTCDQLVCEKCVAICKKLNHAVEDLPPRVWTSVRPGRASSRGGASITHPLNERKQACLVNAEQNLRRYRAWKVSVDQIKQRVRDYGEMLKEKIDRDLEKKMSDVGKWVFPSFIPGVPKKGVLKLFKKKMK